MSQLLSFEIELQSLEMPNVLCGDHASSKTHSVTLIKNLRVYSFEVSGSIFNGANLNRLI